LGSDVPFFLKGPTALACGRGEVLAPISSPPPLAGILVNPGFGVSAGWAYGQFNGQSLATDLTIPSILQALDKQDLTWLADVMVNDLQPGVAMAYPVIRQAQQALCSVGASVTFMSGSGPTVGGIFPPAVNLSSAVAALRRHSAWAVIPYTTLSESFHPELRC
jgi:4-diphosphocytidyl-2-C-methyl-D-erythritol kinase